MNKKEDHPAFGYWKVHTEGDVEGRSIKNLGYHEGFLDEIALNLAPKATYALTFERIERQNEYPRKRAKVKVIVRDTNVDMSREACFYRGSKLLEGRPVRVSESSYYGTFLIQTDDMSPGEKLYYDLSSDIDRLNEERVRLKNEIKRKLEIADKLRQKIM